MKDQPQPFLALRPTLALLGVVALSLAQTKSYFYWHGGLALVVLGTALAFVACVVPGWSWIVPERLRGGVLRCPFGILLTAAGLFLSGLAVLTCDQLYVTEPWAEELVFVATVAGVGVMATLLIDVVAGPQGGKLLGFRVLCLFACGTTIRVGAVLAAPAPIIDVYNLLDEAPQKLLEGENIYRAPYTNPYFPEDPDFRPASYPPLPFLLAVPFRAVGVDVRFANVLLDLLAAVVLYATGRQFGQRVVGALTAGIYLLLPRVPLILENAWFEPMLAGLLGSGLLLVDRGRRLGYVLVGLGLTGKQFGLPMFPPLAWGQRRHWLDLVLGLTVGLAVMVPFFVWDRQAFLEIILFSHLKLPTRVDGFTLHSAAQHLLGLELPRWPMLAVAASLIGWVSLRAPQAGTATALWMGTALLIFILCHTQGFINYFYLGQYLLLLGLTPLAIDLRGKLTDP